MKDYHQIYQVYFPVLLNCDIRNVSFLVCKMYGTSSYECKYIDALLSSTSKGHYYFLSHSGATSILELSICLAVACRFYFSSLADISEENILHIELFPTFVSLKT